MVLGFRVVEIPITFTERIHGTSKMSGGIVWEAAALVPRLRRLGRPPRGGRRAPRVARGRRAKATVRR